MLAVHPLTMYHGVGQPHTAAPREHYRHTQPYPSPTPSGQVYPPRNLIQLPRLPDSQPYARSSPSMTPAEHRRQEPATSHGTSYADSRPPGPSLPAFKDIFASSRSQAPANSPYGAQWDARSSNAPTNQTRDIRENHIGQQPAHSHRYTSSASLQALPTSERPADARLTEQSFLTRASGQAVPTSPYPTYPEARDHVEGRPDGMRRDSPVTYRTNGAPSPYASGQSDDHHYMSPGTAYDRSSVTSHSAPSGPECQRMYLGVKEIPGEGHFHLYDGGYRIPTQIDGEQVNPAWGLTKANKPRKRLALACLDCREKKIKCEPGANSCVQCEKAKRICRRAPLQPPTGDTPPAAAWSSSAGSPPRTGVSLANGSHDANPEALPKRRAVDESFPSIETSKKHCAESPTYRGRGLSTAGEYTGMNGAAAIKSSPTERHRPMYAWEEDPVANEPETTLYLLNLYLMHMNNATVCIFPRHAFWHWVKACQHKSGRELMVLHAVLAVGSIFADEGYFAIGQRHGQIATEAIAATPELSDLFSVQTRLLLALFYSAKGCATIAWEFTGAALRVATNNDLRLNVENEAAVERECQNDAGALERATSHAKKHFSFSRQQYQECKRRTFWVCFLKDRFSAGTLCAINLQDIHLRLPNTDDMYERSLRSEAPYYNNGIVEPSDARIAPTSPVCPMGWLVQVAAIWGDVLNFTNRSVHRGASTYRDSYEIFYAETCNRMQDWASRLPEYLQYSHANLEHSIRSDYADTFISMHAVYHFTFMKLNRYVRHAAVRDLVPRNIRAATSHAQQFLSMTMALRSASCERISPLTGQRCEFYPTTPFIGNITMSAIDIVGAGGLDTGLGAALEAINGGLNCLINLSRFWSTAKEQHRMSQKRCYQIQNIVQQPFKARSGCWLGREWGTMDPLEKEFEPKDDCIYGATEESGRPNDLFFSSINRSVQDDETYRGGPHN